MATATRDTGEKMHTNTRLDEATMTAMIFDKVVCGGLVRRLLLLLLLL